MKRKLIITFTDLDDIQKVLSSLEKLFKEILLYYEETDTNKLEIMIMSISAYFGQLLRIGGYEEEDFKDEK